MLKLLLDEHISRDVAAGLRRRRRFMAAYCLADWEEAALLSMGDSALLEKLAAQQLRLVTYDRRTIPPLLKAWAQEARSHGGVVFVDEKTVPPHDIGGLVQAVLSLFDESRHWDWTDRVCFLRR